MPGIDFGRVHQFVKLRDVVNHLDLVVFSIKGEQAYGPCPLRCDGGRRHQVCGYHLGRNLFHCCRCDAGGSALDLYALVMNTTIYEAAIACCRAAGAEVPYIPRRRRKAGQRRGKQ